MSTRVRYVCVLAMVFTYTHDTSLLVVRPVWPENKNKTVKSEKFSENRGSGMAEGPPALRQTEAYGEGIT